MKLKEAFFLLSRGKQIAVVVWFAHLLAIFGLLGHHLVSRRSKPPRPMIVRTIPASQLRNQEVAKAVSQPKAKADTLQTKKSEPKPGAAIAAKPKSTTPPKPVALIKKPAAASPIKKESASPAAKKVEAPRIEKDESLWNEIAESFEALSLEPKKNSRPPLQLPVKLGAKAQVADLDCQDDPSYGEYLIAYLQNTLDLPEFGEVKAQIEIDRFGKLIDCKILESKSAKNGQFLKNELVHLDFPCLKDFGIADASKTFTIFFRNIDE